MESVLYFIITSTKIIVDIYFNRKWHMRVYAKVSGLSHNEIDAYNNKHSLCSKTKGHGGKTH